MLLKEIDLQNVCQFEKLHVRLQPGLIGVFGPCGSGKSNLVRLIKATLTNDFGFAGTNKAAKVRYDRLADEPAYARTIWELSEGDMAITRSISPARSVLELQGEKLSDQRAIKTKLYQLLGLDEHVISSYIFVDQWQVFNFLQQDKTERLRNFAHLCGAVKLEELWGLLGDQISLDRPLAQYDQLLESDCEAAVAAAQADVSALQAEITALEQTAWSADELQSFSDRLAAAEELETVSQSILQVSQELVDGEQQLDELQRRLDELTAEQAAQQAIMTPQFVARLNSENSLTAQLAKLKHELAEATKVIAAVGGNGVTTCPVCDSPLTGEHATKHIDKQRRVMVENKKEIERLTAYLAETRTLKRQHEERERTLARELESASRNLVELSDAQDTTAEDLERLLAKQQELQATLQDADSQSLLAGWQQQQRLKELLIEKRAQLTSRRESLDSHAELLATVQQRKQKAVAAETWLKDLEYYRSVVHRTNLQAKYMTYVLEEIVEPVNNNLNDFGSPFHVVLDDNLGFTIIKRGGHVEPASVKSGGEWVVLSLAFRMAVSAKFASQVGIMVLDEPTAGLDEYYVDCLAGILRRVNEVTRKRRQQLLIVTHDKRLERVFGQVVRLAA